MWIQSGSRWKSRTVANRSYFCCAAKREALPLLRLIPEIVPSPSIGAGATEAEGVVRSVGFVLERAAARTPYGKSNQEPLRTTLHIPVAGPGGLLPGEHCSRCYHTSRGPIPLHCPPCPTRHRGWPRPGSCPPRWCRPHRSWEHVGRKFANAQVGVARPTDRPTFARPPCRLLPLRLARQPLARHRQYASA